MNSHRYPAGALTAAREYYTREEKRLKAGISTIPSLLDAQDRLIRLEERLRLSEILPEDLRGRIGDLKEGHLIGLRFAPDDEVPDLVRQILDGKLKGRKDIKKAIKTWRPDYYRV